MHYHCKEPRKSTKHTRIKNWRTSTSNCQLWSIYQISWSSNIRQQINKNRQRKGNDRRGTSKDETCIQITTISQSKACCNQNICSSLPWLHHDKLTVQYHWPCVFGLINQRINSEGNRQHSNSKWVCAYRNEGRRLRYSKDGR